MWRLIVICMASGLTLAGCASNAPRPVAPILQPAPASAMQPPPPIPDSGDTVGDLLHDYGALAAQYRDCSSHLIDLQNWIKRREGENHEPFYELD